MKHLQVRDLTASWQGVTVVRNVSFDLPEASLVILRGSDGVAKSTLLQAIAGVVATECGEIELDGTAIDGLRVWERVRRGLVLLDRVRSVFGELTVEDNLRLVSRSSTCVSDAFRLFPMLAPRRAARARVLSGGEQKLLALVRAVISKPRVLLIDELSGGLAPSTVEQVLMQLCRLAESGCAVLVSEQAFAIRETTRVANWTFGDGTVDVAHG